MNVRQFTSDEISEINIYVRNQIPQSLLPTLFVLTEAVEKKVEVFCNIYRILSSIRDFVENESTKNKIRIYLEDIQDIHSLLYPLQLDYKSTDMLTAQSNIKKRMRLVILKYNERINSFIASFLVFSEKQELVHTDNISAIDLDSDVGEELYKTLITKI